jgi:hypothetical protein
MTDRKLHCTCGAGQGVMALEDMQEGFNAAINFALDETEQVEDTRLFLSMWREGDWSAIDETFPEFEISDRLRNAQL